MTDTQRSYTFKILLRAARASVVRISLIFALVSMVKGGLGGAVMVYLIAASISTVGMCVFALVALVMIFRSKKPIHPGVFSLACMGTLAFLVFFLVVILDIGGANSIMELIFPMMFAMLYGAPLGFYMRSYYAKHPWIEPDIAGDSLKDFADRLTSLSRSEKALQHPMASGPGE